MRKRLILRLSALMLIVGILAGCGSGDEEKEASSKSRKKSSKTSEASESAGNQKNDSQETKKSGSDESAPARTKEFVYAGDDGFPTAAKLLDTYYGAHQEVLTLVDEMNAIWKDRTGEYKVYWMFDGKDFNILSDHVEFSGTYDQGILKLYGSAVSSSKKNITLYRDWPEASENNLPAPPSNPTVFEPVSATLRDEYEVTILGAELFYDEEDKQAVRCYFNFTNHNGYGDKIVPASDVGVRLWQGDQSCAQCATQNSPEASVYHNYYVKYGGSACLAAEFQIDWDNKKPLVFQIRHYILSAAEMHDATDKLDPDKTYSVEVEFAIDQLPALPSGGLPTE